jgi:hypothetical protein
MMGWQEYDRQRILDKFMIVCSPHTLSLISQKIDPAITLAEICRLPVQCGEAIKIINACKTLHYENYSQK